MKDESLTKGDLCWVLVKLAGVVLIYHGIAAFYAMMVTWWQLPEVTARLSPEAKKQLMAPIKILFLSSLLPLGIGLRLLVSGVTLHRLLMQVPLGVVGHGGGSLVESRLQGEELEDFRAWIEKNPEIGKRDEVDQLGLFRDAQKMGETESE